MPDGPDIDSPDALSESVRETRARFAALIPAAAREAYRNGDERRAATLLHRARMPLTAGSPEWAILERLEGLLWIAVQREVEGTFALDRADRVLDGLAQSCPGLGYPELEWLE